MNQKEIVVFWRELHASIEVECPYCTEKFLMEEEDVFVLFHRGAMCFIFCKHCEQDFGVDEEIIASGWRE